MDYLLFLLSKFEFEKDKMKKLLLSNTILNCFFALNEDEQELISDKVCDVDFFAFPYAMKENVSDRVYSDGNILKYTHSMICNTFEKTDFNHYELISNSKISSKMQDEIVLDILNDMGFDSLKIYRNLKDNNGISFQNIEESLLGLCLLGFDIVPDKVYLSESINNSIMYIVTLIHELGHVYEGKLMSGVSWKNKISNANVFGEVMSTFFERIALEYMIKNKIYEDDCQRVLNQSYFRLLDNFIEFDEFLYDKYFDDEKDILSKNPMRYAEFGGKTDIDIDDIISSSGNLDYGYGALLGEYFINIYNQDKKDGFRLMRDFVSKQLVIPDRELLESIKFFDGDFKFLEDGIKKNNGYMRKKYKW